MSRRNGLNRPVTGPEMAPGGREMVRLEPFSRA